MADIRSFFSAKPKDQQKSKNASSKNRPKPLISDSSDDENGDSSNHHVLSKTQTTKSKGQTANKPSKRKLSDSSDDEDETISNETSKRSKSDKNKSKTTMPADLYPSNKNIHAKNGNKLKPVDATHFFKSSTANLKPLTKTKTSPLKQDSKKRKKEDEIEEHDDPSFMAMLLNMGDKKGDQKHKKSPKTNEKKHTVLAQDNELNMHASQGDKLSQNHSLSSKLSSNVKVQDRDNVNALPKDTPDPGNSREQKYCEAKIDSKANSNYSKPETSGRTSYQNDFVAQKSCVSSQGSYSPQKRTQSQENIDTRIVKNLPSQLWVDKYKPTTTKGIIGQQGDKSNMKKLQMWLRGWEKYHGVGVTGKPPSRPPPWGASKDDGAWAKAAMLSGPPGVGKTTTSYLVAKEMGYEIMETNASDTRSKKKLDTEISDALSTKSVSNNEAKRLVYTNLRKLIIYFE